MTDIIKKYLKEPTTAEIAQMNANFSPLLLDLLSTPGGHLQYDFLSDGGASILPYVRCGKSWEESHRITFIFLSVFRLTDFLIKEHGEGAAEEEHAMLFKDMFYRSMNFIKFGQEENADAA